LIELVGLVWPISGKEKATASTAANKRTDEDLPLNCKVHLYCI